MAFKTAEQLGVYRPPSTLTDVLRQVEEALALMANATPMMVGKKYLEDFGVGAAPRILFAPEPRGNIGRPREMGNACSVTHSCTVYVRGAEGGDDITRFDNAYALADVALDLIITAGTGCIEWGEFSDSSPANVDAYGADVTFTFTYQRDVRHSATRWTLPAAASNTLAPEPAPPPGEASGDPPTFTVTVTPTT